MHVSALYGYPGSLLRLVPELRRLSLQAEPRATCEQCAMTPAVSGADPSMPWAFDPDLKCCTYHPSLPNFLVGRALARGGRGAAKVEARLRHAAGRTPLRLESPEAYDQRYSDDTRSRFGNDEALRCPYWVGGDKSCGIWLDRGHVCRTWFCKYERGREGRAHWRAVMKCMLAAEHALATFCVEQGDPPDEGAGAEAWATWYVWCARRVHTITDEELEGLRPLVAPHGHAALQSVPDEPEPMPEVLEPSVGDFQETGEGVRLMGYSGYDGIEGPPSVFRFLSLLDGERPWRDALQATNEVAEQPVTEGLVEELYRIGALRTPGGEPLQPIEDHPGWFRNRDGGLVYVVDPAAEETA